MIDDGLKLHKHGGNSLSLNVWLKWALIHFIFSAILGVNLIYTAAMQPYGISLTLGLLYSQNAELLR